MNLDLRALRPGRVQGPKDAAAPGRMLHALQAAGGRYHASPLVLRQAFHHAQFHFHVTHHCADADIAGRMRQTHAAAFAA